MLKPVCNKKQLYYLLRSTLSLLAVLAFAFPTVWIVLTSFKTHADAISLPPVFLAKPTGEAYTTLFLAEPFTHYSTNSLIVTCSALAIALVVGYPAAYSLARFEFRRKADINFWMLSLFMLPPIAVVFPYMLMFKRVGMIDTYPILILTHLTFVLPLVIWLLKGFIAEVPLELEEAAAVDGAGLFLRMFRIVLPNMRSGFAATLILGFIFSWNEFTFALFLAPFKVKTLPPAAIGLVSFASIEWNVISAAIVVIIFPAVLITLLAQGELAKGMRGLVGK